MSPALSLTSDGSGSGAPSSLHELAGIVVHLHLIPAKYVDGMDRITVLVADDQLLFARGPYSAVQVWPELELVARAADGRSALAVIRRGLVE
jgi:hypothetical protein